ncbi:MAG: diacylglycerol kinase family protein [Pseudomonadota bacterium]|nr:diacylglycerol kinase family protein [Pseudomonadota bacterium]
MKALALINENAGAVSRLGLEEARAALAEEFANAGWGADFETGDAEALIARAKQAGGYDAVICAGGDGTQAGVASALLRGETPMLPLPCGTMNLLCRDLGLPMDMREALAEGLRAKPAKIDAGCVRAEEIGERIFLNNIVFGAYANLAEAREFMREAETLDDLSFAAVHAASALINAKPAEFSLDLDGEPRLFRSNTLVVSNNPLTGSIDLTPTRSRLDEGVLAVYLMEAEGGASFAARLMEFLTGDIDVSARADITRCARCTVSVREGPVIYAIDGEPQESAGTVTMTLLPGALAVLAPAFAAA